MQVSAADQTADLLRQLIGGQRAGGYNHTAFRDFFHFLPADRYVWVLLNLLRHQIGKLISVHSQRAARLHAGGIGAL